ncbi:hypothetical protein D9M72_407320 [compost metagenome]
MIVRDARVADFVGSKIGVVFNPPLTCLGIEKNGEIVGGAVFNVFEGHDIHVSMAGRGATKGFLAEVGHYAYTVLGCERMTVITEKPEVVRLAEKLGGQVEGMLRNHFGKDRPAFVVGILKSEYRF